MEFPREVMKRKMSYSLDLDTFYSSSEVVQNARRVITCRNADVQVWSPDGRIWGFRWLS